MTIIFDNGSMHIETIVWQGVVLAAGVPTNLGVRSLERQGRFLGMSFGPTESTTNAGIDFSRGKWSVQVGDVCPASFNPAVQSAANGTYTFVMMIWVWDGK